MTAGTDPPNDVQIVREQADSIKLAWTPGRTYGSNRLQGTVVRWAENRRATSGAEDWAGADELARYRSLQASILFEFKFKFEILFWFILTLLT